MKKMFFTMMVLTILNLFILGFAVFTTWNMDYINYANWEKPFRGSIGVFNIFIIIAAIQYYEERFKK